MTEQLRDRFQQELDKMDGEAVTRYKKLVADELCRAVLRTLSILEKKELYQMCEFRLEVIAHENPAPKVTPHVARTKHILRDIKGGY